MRLAENGRRHRAGPGSCGEVTATATHSPRARSRSATRGVAWARTTSAPSISMALPLGKLDGVDDPVLGPNVQEAGGQVEGGAARGGAADAELDGEGRTRVRIAGRGVEPVELAVRGADVEEGIAGGVDRRRGGRERRG